MMNPIIGECSPLELKLKALFAGTDITMHTEKSSFGLFNIRAFLYRGSPILRLLTPGFVSIKDKGTQPLLILKYSVILKKIITTPLDNMPLLVHDESYHIFSGIIKHILENGGIKHEGPEPLVVINTLLSEE